MTEKAEALWLADALESVVGGELCNRAAAELRRLHAECDALRAEVDRLTTLRPASEHDGEKLAHWYERDEDQMLTPCWGSRVQPNHATHWTPIPDLKESK